MKGGGSGFGSGRFVLAMQEEWVFVTDTTEVSSLGRVRQYVTGHPDSDGYLRISGGRRGAKYNLIHNLVAKAFLGVKQPGQIVRHLNDKREDNRAANLAYGTRGQNYADAVRNGRVDPWCPVRLARLLRVASQGGAWWKGRKRHGFRGKAVR